MVREKKPPKEESKLLVHYRVRGVEQLASKLEVSRNFKLRQLKKLILEDLGLFGQANIKAFINEVELEKDDVLLKELNLD